MGGDCWRRWWPDYLGGDGYYHKCLTRGRVFGHYNLVASTLWHKLMVVEPPEELVTSIQKKLVDFFWDGKHRIRAAQLFLPPCEGGQGLIDIKSRIQAF